MNRGDFLGILDETQRDWDHIHGNGWDHRQLEKTPSLNHYIAAELEARWNAALVAAMEGRPDRPT